MNKAQKREVAMIETYIGHGMTDTAARSLSALIRSALTNKTKRDLIAMAEGLRLAGHPEFII